MVTLVIVDVQNDFLPGGSLAVPDGDTIVKEINAILPNFDLVVATQDWHPQNHQSFASNHKGKEAFEKVLVNGLEQVLWPDHCVQGTFGADFPSTLNMNSVAAIFRKGMDKNMDSYSGFFDNNHNQTTGLSGYLKEKGAKDLYFCGLAADICVYYTLQDALKEGFHVTLLLDATRPLNQDVFLKQKQNFAAQGIRMQ
ncbi:MAG: nicotinamidase/pyrazinamidase [Flavobacteriaceae bacterium CG_4_8_14_3_um_filter_34_10]|nr:bifunctional nicotinamidase/pyrazinamidase [Flavobacteriia bacterium]OIP51429.1 MAG: nicotinamidase [Flavobacteriaceae bacterium CG2_30_34_30]PIQ17910.1 MAG: nicotinamidase/pyrazinamidase [Flavobacteriaceae bacterium CG18_big_fil_WC_8_21_14_2_50_34_36]PIV51819.1 MAG: nicotinamidase/pyrazinamidase [Flavobacteriaceae bacterium CG02_land_8_20_14_3_00_34_13]PIX09634.1 MAG: nicotinamidase/pyrazinamidase [Flavobacteriaceae bacterium CG_4_8_14_3_um_filter_34_10]PIZ08918.1 MAG: nicotinamidase/pyraz